MAHISADTLTAAIVRPQFYFSTTFARIKRYNCPILKAAPKGTGRYALKRAQRAKALPRIDNAPRGVV